MEETADKKRLEAVFCWINDFFGSFAKLPSVSGYDALWKEHIPTLTTLCTSKGLLNKRLAKSPVEAYNVAKTTLQIVDSERLFNGRSSELDPASAAAGNETAIYKFIVLMLSVISIDMEEYIEEAENMLAEKGHHTAMAQLVAQVNAAGQYWWQGSVDESSSSPGTSSTENESFCRYEPTTPRSVLRRTVVAPQSPIHNAVNSPLTIMKRKEEIRRLREREANLEEENAQQRETIDQHQEKEKELRERLAKKEAEWRAAEKEKQLQSANYERTYDQLERAKSEIATLRDKIKTLKHTNEQSQEEKKAAISVNTALSAELEALKASKQKIERDLRDSSNEVNEARKELHSLEQLFSKVRQELDQKTADLKEQEDIVQQMSAKYRADVAQKEEMYNQLLVTLTDQQVQLRGLQQNIKDLEESKLSITTEKSEMEKLYEGRLADVRKEEAKSKEIVMETNTHLEEQLARLRRQFEQNLAELSERSALNLNQEQKLLDITREADSLRVTISNLQEQLEEAIKNEEKVKEIKIFEANLESMRAQLAERDQQLQEQLDSMKKMEFEHTAMLEEREENMQAAREKIEMLEAQISELTSEREQLREKENRLIVAERTLGMRDELIQQLEDNRKKLMEDNEFQKAYYGKMSGENQKLSEKLQEARSNLEQNEDAILQKQETIRDLKERLKALEMGADELATENRQLRDEKNILKIQLQELSDTLAIHEQQQMAGAHDDSEISADVVEEESLIQHDETINVNDCDTTIVDTDTLRTNSRISGSFNDENLDHLDWANDEEDHSVFFMKSIIDGNDYEEPVTSRRREVKDDEGFNFDMNKDRVDELKRRNQQLHPAMRSSYALEMSNYSSPSANEKSMQNPRDSLPSEERQFEEPKTPHVDKENVPVGKPPKSSNSKFSRRVSSVFGIGNKNK